ncbi:acetate/propionate family kinase [Acidipila sp. EB88]|uniref:acetate/propionate family kinase n=1 Tax=Acidipila sp. EB88 TaxID=2305226 RepID=UPI000F5F8FCB|nr:acetate/propionate family kinase [Acidipila sp. EB88]RRA49641.1 acetate/propionate family kinase [Acidipila sp. EB88]
MSAAPAEHREQVSPSAQRILVLNSGSSSLKAGLFVPEAGVNFAGERALFTAEASGIGSGKGSLALHDGEGKEIASNAAALGSQAEALEAVRQALQAQQPGAHPAAVCHRIVHGGPRLRNHTRVTPDVLSTLRASIHFAPLHLPASIELLEQAGTLFPDVPQIACFDTAFHQTMPAVAKQLPIPSRFSAEGVERYGFHGLSYESLVRQLQTESDPLPERIVFAHLGGGSSLCGVLRGRSVDTTMGLTPAGGVPMATRTGDLDPGVLLFLARRAGLSLDDLETMVNHEAGLAGIAGGSGDMQQLEKQSHAPDGTPQSRAEAALAFDLFAIAVAKAIAGLVVSLHGLDLLVFAGGIGEHSAPLRAAVLEKLAPFGIRIDAEANVRHGAGSSEDCISTANSKVPVRIVRAEEDLVIAAHGRTLLHG